MTTEALMRIRNGCLAGTDGTLHILILERWTRRRTYEIEYTEELRLTIKWRRLLKYQTVSRE